MTCLFCSYEFCWACGGSATRADRHFEFGRGCGVKQMDDTVKPGDHMAELELKCSDEIFEPFYMFSVFVIFHYMRCPSCKSILIFLLFFLLAPLIGLVLIPSGIVRKYCRENPAASVGAKIFTSVILVLAALPLTVFIVVLFYFACALHFILALLRILCWIICCPCSNN